MTISTYFKVKSNSVNDVEDDDTQDGNQSLQIISQMFNSVTEVPVGEHSSSTIARAIAIPNKQSLLTSCVTNIKEYKGSEKKYILCIFCFVDGGVKAGKISNAIVYMIAKDNLPLKIVDNEGFKYLMKITSPLYKVPCRATIANLIDEKYQLLSSQIKVILKITKQVSLSTHVWTDCCNIKSYLGLTCQFIEGNDIKSIIIGVYELKESHTSDYLRQILKNI